MIGYIITATGTDSALYVVDQIVIPLVMQLPVPQQQRGAMQILGQENNIPYPIAVSAYYCFECRVNEMSKTEQICIIDVDMSKPQFITPDKITSIINVNDRHVLFEYHIAFINTAQWPTQKP